VHVAGAYGPHEYSVAGLPRRENDEGVSSFFRPSDRQETLLCARILKVGHNQGRRMSENMLHLATETPCAWHFEELALSQANPEKGTFCIYKSSV
jgi:hypothetical protein